MLVTLSTNYGRKIRNTCNETLARFPTKLIGFRDITVLVSAGRIGNIGNIWLK